VARMEVQGWSDKGRIFLAGGLIEERTEEQNEALK
jgi:hypothetical protein